jgi:hypothetical protein
MLIHHKLIIIVLFIHFKLMIIVHTFQIDDDNCFFCHIHGALVIQEMISAS